MNEMTLDEYIEGGKRGAGENIGTEVLGKAGEKGGSILAGNKEVDYLLDQTKMYNNLLEADDEEYIWDENNLIFKNSDAQTRDRLGCLRSDALPDVMY